jgi:hypothetical protein
MIRLFRLTRQCYQEPANGAMKTSPFFEIALVLVRLDHLAGFIVNANQGIM